MGTSKDNPFVSRAGLKLEHALDEFDLDVTDLLCADFGCNVGGFTDCLLQRGAKRIYALDTGYGTLAWKLRSDDRVIVMERTNAIHADPPPDPDGTDPLGVDLVVIDLGWTPQRLAVPAALKWLAPVAKKTRAIISLIKPHYELDEDEKHTLLTKGALDPAVARRIFQRVLESLPALGVEVIAHTRSPLTGRKSSRGKNAIGNIEFLAFLKPSDHPEKNPT